MKSCVRCGQKNGDKSKYCRRCGAPLVNKCTNLGSPMGEPCSKVNDDDAVYCSDCGAYTTFYHAGLLQGMYPEKQAPQMDELRDFELFTHRFFTED